MSLAHQRRGTRPPAAGRPWTPREDHLLRTLPVNQVAAKTGRTKVAVLYQRQVLGLTKSKRGSS